MAKTQNLEGTVMNFVSRWLSCTIAIGFAAWIVPGISTIGGSGAE